MKATIVSTFLMLCAGIATAQEPCSSDIPFGDNTEAGRFANVDNSTIYYETYGDPANRALVLIHGNGGSISSMRCQILHFMVDYHVIVADNRTHGQSGDSDALTYDQMAADYAAVLTELSLDSVYILGQSDGGIVGLLLAIDYPRRVGKLVAAVPNLRPGGSAIAAWELEFSRNYSALIDSMISAGNEARDWPNEKLHMELIQNEPHITLAELGTISCPVLIMTSDDDIIRPRHILEIYESIPNAQLFMMPCATHFMIRDEYELFNYMAARFFNRPFTRPRSREVLVEMIGGG